MTMHHDLHPLVAKAIEYCGSQPELARRMNCRQQTVSKLLHRRIGITAETAMAIHIATAGSVPASSLRPDLWRRAEDVPVDLVGERQGD